MEIIHRKMERVATQPAALPVIEVSPVKVCQAVGDDQTFGPDAEASLVPRRKLIQEAADGPVRGSKTDHLTDPRARLEQRPHDAELPNSPAVLATRCVDGARKQRIIHR